MNGSNFPSSWNGLSDFFSNSTTSHVNHSPNSYDAFEKVYAAYNVVQAGLTYLQKSPELAGTIFKVQKVLLITDCLGLILSASFLFDKLEKEWKDSADFPFFLKVSAACITTAALSYFAVLGIHHYSKPVFVLNDFLRELSPVSLKDINITWNSPTSHRFMQGVFISRIASNIACSIFSNQKTLNAISTVALTSSLFGISKLRWIELTEVVRQPFKDLTIGETFKDFKITSNFLVDPSCAKNELHLKSSLTSIHEYTSKIFENCLWIPCRVITQIFNKATDRNGNTTTYFAGYQTSYEYHLKLQKNILQACANISTPQLINLTIQDMTNSLKIVLNSN